MAAKVCRQVVAVLDKNSRIVLSYRTKDGKPDALFVDWVGGDDDFTPAEQHQRDGDFRPRLRERASSRAMARAAYWATKLLPYAGCGRSA